MKQSSPWIRLTKGTDWECNCLTVFFVTEGLRSVCVCVRVCVHTVSYIPKDVQIIYIIPSMAQLSAPSQFWGYKLRRPHIPERYRKTCIENVHVQLLGFPYILIQTIVLMIPKPTSGQLCFGLIFFT